VSCGVGCRRGSDPTLLWPWCRPAATALIRPLAWEPPYAAGAALEKAKKKKNAFADPHPPGAPEALSALRTVTLYPFICQHGGPTQGQETTLGCLSLSELTLNSHSIDMMGSSNVFVIKVLEHGQESTWSLTSVVSMILFFLLCEYQESLLPEFPL